jgi:hypothetical protein
MIRIEDIVQRVRGQFPSANLDVMRRAYLFSMRERRGQKLPSGEHYMVHCLEVANVLAESRFDEVCVSAGLLCQVGDDRVADLDTLHRYFGKEIANIVDRVAQPINSSFEMAGDSRIATVQLANRVSTLRRLRYVDRDKIERIVRETVEQYVPLATRLGLTHIQTELETLVNSHNDVRNPDFKDEAQAEEGIALVMIGGRVRLVSLSHDGTYRFLDGLNNLHHIVYICSSETLRLQQAVEELEELINNPKTREQSLQEFFERNPEFILNEDYKSAHSKVVLANEQGDKLIPDFLLEPTDQGSLCDLLELKTPSQKVFALKKSRMRFSAAVMEACSQLREYSAFFDEERHRKAIQDQYGLSVYKPKMFVIIGRQGGLTPIEMRRVESDMPWLRLRTYDDLVRRVKNKIKRMDSGGSNAIQ